MRRESRHAIAALRRRTYARVLTSSGVGVGLHEKATSRRNDSVGSKSGAAGVEAGSGEGRRKSYFRRSGASRVAQLSVRSAPIGRILRFRAVILSERVREARKTARRGRRPPCGTGPT